MHRYSRALALVWALAAGIGACSEKAAPVDRVQPNLIDKSVLQGEWWYSSTSIDTQYDEAWVFNSAGAFAPYDGAMSTDYGLDYNRGGSGVIGEPAYSFPIGRIRFVIDEHYLFAFRSFELVAGGNEGGEGPDFTGQPLAVFKIDAHVDVRREYDEITGEETNVTVENQDDRQWHERKYVRVDWSQNLVTQFLANDVQSNELFTQFKREPVPFFFQQGAHGDFPKSYEPQLVRVKDDPAYARSDEWPADQGDTVHYMSFVTQEIWSPRGSCLERGGVCASVTATMRNSFLRVPPEHQYAVRTETHEEFDHFGLFRSHEPTYARGGEDTAVEHAHCDADADCGEGRACDNADRRADECKALGEKADCRKETKFCVGGLTDDRGETDFLRFFVSRHNLYAKSLTDKTCRQDWECDGRYDTCEGLTGKTRQACLDAQTSVCDPAARRCTLPVAKRPTRPVVYRLSPHFPPYLVRRAFDAVAQWNEALMRGQRAALGLLPTDQALCADDKTEVCTSDLRKAARVDCQNTDPTAFCYCGSPEEVRGTCRRDYDPYESPAKARARGIPSPYDCYVSGPKDQAHPTRFESYDTKDAYDYEFRGDECLLKLEVNSCDRDAELPCEELGDLRHHFFSHIQHGGAGFAGVAAPLSDPKTGELIVSNATVAAESLERFGTLASQLYPVLRGEAPEDSYFTGENVRGYFSRLGRVEHPVATVAQSSSGSQADDTSRPESGADAAADVKIDALKSLRDRALRLGPKLAALQGREGRAQLLSDRKLGLRGTPLDAKLAAALEQAGEAPALASGMSALDALQTELQAEQRRKQQLAARNIDVLDDALYDSQYHRYFAEAFRGRSLDEAALRMQQAYFTSVTLHELGHALGLRHNFAASLDRDNYADGYYSLQDQTPLPNYLEYDAPELGGNDDGDIAGEEAQRFARDLRDAREERLRAGAGNVMTSSVMDYAADMSDLTSLGRYDQAAALYSYFSKVEAYAAADPSAGGGTTTALAQQGLERPDLHRRELFTYYRGGDDCRSDADCPSRAGRESVAFQPISQRCIPNPRLSSQDAPCSEPGACICSSYFDDITAHEAGTALRGGDARYANVDYLYCHDNRTADLSWCTPFDAGESFQEVVEHYRRSWRERYPRAYFRNYRSAGPQRGAAYSDMAAAVKIYQHMFFRLSYEGADYQDSVEPLGFYDQLTASAATFDFLAEIIGTPDVGSYVLDSKAKVYRQISSQPGAAGADLSLSLGQGFHLWSEYQTGLNGYFRLERAGTFLDKLLAIQSLAKRDWSLPYQVDEFFYVNFFDFFEPEIVDLFGGLIMRNPRAYAPRVVKDSAGDIVLSYPSAYRGFASERRNQDVTYPEPAVDGTGSEVLRDIAAIEALSEFPVYYDTSFEQRLLIWKLGTGDGYTIPTARPDGTPTCAYGAAGCTEPDYIVYGSDRLHTSYVAVVIGSNRAPGFEEQQLSFELLRKLSDRQTRIRALTAVGSPSDAQRSELAFLREELSRDESFLEYLIELQRSMGISSYFY